MTFGRIIFRGLVHHWRTNLCVVAGLAVATAVITGSLMVGDSMTGSLRRMALARIGQIDYVIATPTFFRAALTKDLPGHADTCIVTTGIARVADADSGSVRVNVCGVDDAFWNLFPESRRTQLSDRNVAISQALADDLGVKVGDELLISLPRPSLIPGSSLFAKRKREQTIRSIRVAIEAIFPQQGVGGFNLQAGSTGVRNVFVARDFLARSMEKPDLANLLFVAMPDRPGSDLQTALNRVCMLSDYGLRVTRNQELGYVSLESDSILLTPQQIRAAEKAAQSVSTDVARSSVYLATRIASAKGSTLR